MGSFPILSTYQATQAGITDKYLLSEDVISFTDIISEGRIEGIIDEKGNVMPNITLGKGIYFDEIPVQNDQGRANFNNIVLSSRNGSQDMFQSPDQNIRPSNFRYLNKEINYGEPFEFDIIDPDASIVTITMEISQLFTENGANGHKVGLKIYLRRITVGAETPYELMIDEGFVGRAISPYRKAYTIPLTKSVFSNRDKWRVRIFKLPITSIESDEETNLEKRRELRVNSYFWTYNDTFVYPTSALCNTSFGSESLQNLPRRNFRVKGLRVKVPNNYSPVNGRSNGFFASFYYGSGFNYCLGTGIHSIFDYDFKRDAPVLHNFPSGFSAKFSGYINPDRQPFPIAMDAGTISGAFYIDYGNGAGFQSVLDSRTNFTGKLTNVTGGRFYPFYAEVSSSGAYPTTSNFAIYYPDKTDYISSDTIAAARNIESNRFSIDNTSERSYDGFWDGTFYKHKIYTNNPAWIFYDMQTNKRHGLGRYISKDHVDKWGLYEISQYCDQLVYIPEAGDLFLSGAGTLGDHFIRTAPIAKSIKSGTNIYFYYDSNLPFDPVVIKTTGDAYAGATGILIEPLGDDYEPYTAFSVNGYGTFEFPSEMMTFYVTGNNSPGANQIFVSGFDLDVKSGTRLTTVNTNGTYELRVSGNVSSGAHKININTPLTEALSASRSEYPYFHLYNWPIGVLGGGGLLFPGMLVVKYSMFNYYGFPSSYAQTFEIKEQITLPSFGDSFTINLVGQVPSELIDWSDIGTTQFFVLLLDGTVLELFFRDLDWPLLTLAHDEPYADGQILPAYNGQKNSPFIGEGSIDINRNFFITGEAKELSNTEKFYIEPLGYSIYSGLNFTVGGRSIPGVVSGSFGINSIAFSGSFSDNATGESIETFGPSYSRIGYGRYQASEPRFTFNGYIQDYADAYEAIKSFTSVFRAFSYWGDGRIILVQDKEEDPFTPFSNANVVDGDFAYSNTSKSSRYNLLKVRYSDPENFYKTNIVQVEDPPNIIKYGIREKEINAFGCTSKYQAQRFGRYIIETENNLTELVNFRVGAEGAILYPGAVIKIYDYKKYGLLNAGRIIENNLYGSSGGDETSFFAVLDRELEIANQFENRQYFSGEFFTSGDAAPYSFFRCIQPHSGAQNNKGSPAYWQKYCVSGDGTNNTWAVGDVAYTGTGPENVVFYYCKQANSNQNVTNSTYWLNTGRNIDRFKFYHISPKQILSTTGISNSQEYKTGIRPSQLGTPRNIIAPWSHKREDKLVYLNGYYDGAGALLTSGSANTYGYMWLMETAFSPKPEQYRVLSVGEENNGEVSVSAIQYDPDLFDRIDNREIGVT